jgi:hypothetical protein
MVREKKKKQIKEGNFEGKKEQQQQQKKKTSAGRMKATNRKLALAVRQCCCWKKTESQPFFSSLPFLTFFFLCSVHTYTLHNYHRPHPAPHPSPP